MKHIKRLYVSLTTLYLGLFIMEVLRLLFDIYEPDDNVFIRAIGYLILANLNVIMYNQTRRED